MRSHILEGVVRHRRARPVVYSLEHGVYYLALDLDEMTEVDRSLREQYTTDAVITAAHAPSAVGTVESR